jgi:hypothetical protein
MFQVAHAKISIKHGPLNAALAIIILSEIGKLESQTIPIVVQHSWENVLDTTNTD